MNSRVGLKQKRIILRDTRGNYYLNVLLPSKDYKPKSQLTTKERRRQYNQDYFHRPEVIERRKKWRKEYENKPENKERIRKRYREYCNRPEVKKHRNELQRRYRYHERRRKKAAL